MRFILDENVPMSVARFLRGQGFDVEYVRDLLPEGSVDPLVAFVAEEHSAILVTFDGDFKHIAPRIPDGQRRRFRNLSRIWLRCNEYQAADRMERALSFIQAEHQHAMDRGDRRMILSIGNSYIRSER